ncbi:hypothetical protein [Minisyncoccus archaeiphilus]|uniref:hypothetical protein n=1 Tax=Minisyncoccus archaeiphilus TaxID=3238481 RepID=UPI0009C6D1CB|nr:MAG: hypothetical protein BWY21_01377 [Parcubacteria group bacterium ADurb.Bin216]
MAQYTILAYCLIIIMIIILWISITRRFVLLKLYAWLLNIRPIWIVHPRTYTGRTLKKYAEGKEIDDYDMQMINSLTAIGLMEIYPQTRDECDNPMNLTSFAKTTSYGIKFLRQNLC